MTHFTYGNNPHFIFIYATSNIKLVLLQVVLSTGNCRKMAKFSALYKGISQRWLRGKGEGGGFKGGPTTNHAYFPLNHESRMFSDSFHESESWCRCPSGFGLPYETVHFLRDRGGGGLVGLRGACKKNWL